VGGDGVRRTLAAAGRHGRLTYGQQRRPVGRAHLVMTAAIVAGVGVGRGPSGGGGGGSVRSSKTELIEEAR